MFDGIFFEILITLLNTYMEIGKLLVNNNLSFTSENTFKEKEEKSLRTLSKELTKRFGKGFSKSNLNNMINFYLEYNSVQTLSGQLTWSHYCELLSISDKDKRKFYEIECAEAKWGVRELKRQNS